MSLGAINWALRQGFVPGYAQAKLVLVVLAHHYSDKERRAFPKVALLAQECSMSEKHVHRMLKLLRDGKLIRSTKHYLWNGHRTASSYYLPDYEAELGVAAAAVSEPTDIDVRSSEPPSDIDVRRPTDIDVRKNGRPTDIDVALPTDIYVPIGTPRGELPGSLELPDRELPGLPAPPAPASTLASAAANSSHGESEAARFKRLQVERQAQAAEVMRQRQVAAPALVGVN